MTVSVLPRTGALSLRGYTDVAVAIKLLISIHFIVPKLSFHFINRQFFNHQYECCFNRIAIMEREVVYGTGKQEIRTAAKVDLTKPAAEHSNLHVRVIPVSLNVSD